MISGKIKNTSLSDHHILIIELKENLIYLCEIQKFIYLVFLRQHFTL